MQNSNYVIYKNLLELQENQRILLEEAFLQYQSRIQSANAQGQHSSLKESAAVGLEDIKKQSIEDYLSYDRNSELEDY